METETQTATVRLDDCGPGHVTLVAPVNQSIVLNLADLQAVVQAVYDQHGILAEPSLEVERRAYEARQAEAEDVELRTFADAWGESLRGQS